MEWKHIIVTKTQNTLANGYGPLGSARPDQLLKIWADFYEIEHFPSYEEAATDVTGRYIQCNDGYFDTLIYKRRMYMVIEPFLIEANARGEAAQKKVYVSATGLGLGVWKKIEQQGSLLGQVYLEILTKNDFRWISDIDCTWWSGIDGISSGEALKNIIIHKTKNPPCLKLDSDKLLVTQFTWDSNSFVGNEYWVGALSASGDPAAACCSTIAELLNPLINTIFSNIHIFYGK